MMNSTLGDLQVKNRKQSKSKLLMGTGKQSPYNSKKKLIIYPKIDTGTNMTSKNLELQVPDLSSEGQSSIHNVQTDRVRKALGEYRKPQFKHDYIYNYLAHHSDVNTLRLTLD